jgi:hypothetical protein
MADDPDSPPRPPADEGDLYVYSEEDASKIAAEAYAWLREIPELDEGRAEEIATMFYDLLTGDWITADSNE